MKALLKGGRSVHTFSKNTLDIESKF